MVTTSTASQTGEPTPALPVTDTWLVIPLYNEATVVREVISQARTVFPHVVVVDDDAEHIGRRTVAAEDDEVVDAHPLELDGSADSGEPGSHHDHIGHLPSVPFRGRRVRHSD